MTLVTVSCNGCRKDLGTFNDGNEANTAAVDEGWIVMESTFHVKKVAVAAAIDIESMEGADIIHQDVFQHFCPKCMGQLVQLFPQMKSALARNSAGTEPSLQ